MLISTLIDLDSSVWFSFAILLIVLLAASPLFGYCLSNRPRVEAVGGEKSGRIVLLIHGTFAPRALWTGQQSILLSNLRVLQLRSFEVYRLLWSGCNFQRDREQAVRCLCDWIQNTPEATEICLIGHSHGGNIAALAASRLPERAIKVVTLSTPFVVASSRPLTFLPVRAGSRGLRDEKLLITSLCVLVGFVPALPMLIQSFNITLLILAIISTLLLNLVVLGSLSDLKRIRDGMLARLEISVHADRILILRATNDEASGFLGLSSVVGSMTSALFRLMGALAAYARSLEESIVSRPATGIPFAIVFGLLGFALSADVKWLEGWLPQHLFHWFQESALALAITWLTLAAIGLRALPLLLAPVLTIFGVIASMSLSIGFGIDLAIVAVSATVSAEASPVGRYHVVSVPGDSWKMAHSSLYDSVGAAYHIQHFLDLGAENAAGDIVTRT